MKALFPVILAALAFVAACPAQEDATAAAAGPTSAVTSAASLSSGPVVVFDFKNVKLSPSYWTLTLREYIHPPSGEEPGEILSATKLYVRECFLS